MSSFPELILKLKSKLQENRRAGAIGAASAVFLGLLFLMSATLGRGLNNLSYDFPFVIRAALPMFQPPVPTNDIMIVYMDDPSHRELQQPWLQPWDRSVHARLVEVLAAQHAKAVVFDVLFDMPSTNDEKLIRAAASYRRVVVGGVLEPQTYEGKFLFYQPNPPIAALRGVVQWGLAERADSDRTIRQHFPGHGTVPSLAWKTAELTMTNRLPESSGVRWLNYYGPPGALPFRSFVDVLNTNFPANAFSNKVVFVGPLYNVGFTGGKGTDDFRTPYTRWTQTRSPGVELNAITYLNLLRKDWLTELSPMTEFVLVLFAGVLLGFGLILLRPTVATAVAGTIFLALAGIECLLVWRYRLWFPWLTIGFIQLLTTFAWSLLANIKMLYREKDLLEEKLATAITVQPTSVMPKPDGPTQVILMPGLGQPGGPLPAPPIPNHEMLRCIGKGAYGEVWLARDEIGTYHAVKIVHRKSFNDSGPFDREFRGIQQYTPISRTHHGLVHILHVGRNKEAGYFFYIMELGDCELHGQKIDPETYCARNLGRELDFRGKLPVKECVHLAMELAEALHYLHSKQLIHRDIKPSNIIFVNGIPKFADVGLVTHIAEKGRDVTYLGTEGFIAPEGPGTPAADVYSLGKVIYEASMGRSASHYPDLPTTLTQRSDQGDLLQLHEIILKACDPDLQRRYKNATELQTDLMHLNDRLYGGVQRAHP